MEGTATLPYTPKPAGVLTKALDLYIAIMRYFSCAVPERMNGFSIDFHVYFLRI